ncbi:MAG: permease [Lentisphaerae bacterium]|nr:permease [Lentisphaerota bacterium]
MWSFIQDELLGMKWLERLTGQVLTYAGVDIEQRLGGSLHFFIYDVIKIMVLLCTLIFVISYIQSYFPPERSRRILGRFHGFRARMIGALLGTVTPFCSCSSIPLFIGFTRAGLPLGVTFSFLISSPMVDLGSLVLLISIFGWKTAVAYVLLGLLMAILGGTAIEWMHMESEIQEYIIQGSLLAEEEGNLRWRERCSFAWEQLLSTAEKVFPYVIVGVAIGSFIHNWIPEEMIIAFLGERNPLGVLLATLFGVPMYADIFGTIPIAEALLAKGAMLGVVLSFMMAVTTLSLPSIILLKRAVKNRLLAVFVGVCILGIIIIGFVFNMIQHLLV